MTSCATLFPERAEGLESGHNGQSESNTGRAEFSADITLLKLALKGLGGMLAAERQHGITQLC